MKTNILRQDKKKAETQSSLKKQLVIFQKGYYEIYYSKTWQTFLFGRKLIGKIKKGFGFLLNPSLRITDLQKIFKTIKSNKFVVINLPLINWQRKKQRPQHLCEQFAKNKNLVFYINNHFIALSKTGLTKDQIGKKIEIRKLEEKIYQVTLVSYHNLAIDQDQVEDLWDKRYISWSFEVLRQVLGKRKKIVKIDNPFWFTFIKNSQDFLLYDCFDNFDGFLNVGSILELEPLLAKKANLVLTSSNFLLKKMRKYKKCCFLVENAADFKIFSKKSYGIPKEMQSLDHPIIGYYGAIGDWFDDQLLLYLANKKPTWNFVIIGNISDPEKLQSIIRAGVDNIHILNQKNYQDLPSYLYYFDVCLIPFLINKLTKAVNPIKFFEYIASGKPVVSTNLPEVRQYKQPYVYLAKTKKEFLKKIELVLKENNKDFAHKRRKLAKKNTWDIRYQQINNIISRYYE